MPTEDEEDQETGQDNVVQLKRSDIRAMEKKARRADDLQAQVDQLNRKFAFTEAGLDMSNKGVSYFVKGYEGELTAEAIRTAAKEAGFITEKPPPTAQQTGQTPMTQTQLDHLNGSQSQGLMTEEFQAMQRIRQMATQPLGSQDNQMLYYQELANAKNADEVMEIANKYGLPTTHNRG
jgi:hypothetical protein